MAVVEKVSKTRAPSSRKPIKRKGSAISAPAKKDGKEMFYF